MDVAIPLVFFSLLGGVFAYKLPEGDPVQHRARLRNILLAALFLRIVLATLFATIPAIRFFHEDAEGYEWWGRQIARSWVSDVNADDYALNRPQNYGYPYLIAVFNLLLGESLAIGSMLNAVVGMLSVLAVYRLACDSFHPIVGLRAAKFVAFFPSMVLWSSLALKDPLITLLAVMTLHMAIRLKRRFSLRDVLVLIFCVVAIQPMRFYIIYFIGFAIAVSMLLDRGRNLVRNLYLQIFLGGVLVAAVVLLGLGNRVSSGAEVFNLQRVSEFRKGMASTAQSGFAENIDISTPLGAALFLPIGLAVLLLGPFPWQMLSFRAAMTLPEMLVWWAMIPPLIAGLRYAAKNLLARTAPILLFSATLSVAYSLIHGNVGSGFRQRTQIFVFLFIFGSFGHYLKRCKKKGIDETALLVEPPGAVNAASPPSSPQSAAA